MYQFYNRCTNCGKVMSRGGKTLCYNCQRLVYQRGMIDKGTNVVSVIKEKIASRKKPTR